MSGLVFCCIKHCYEICCEHYAMSGSNTSLKYSVLGIFNVGILCSDRSSGPANPHTHKCVKVNKRKAKAIPVTGRGGL
jgi:hypothetical protein